MDGISAEYNTLRDCERRWSADALVEIAALPRDDAATLVERWLNDKGRTLTSLQRDAVLGAHERCPLPLFLRLVFEEVRWWRSDERPSELPPDISAAIRRLFSRLSDEANHGAMLVGRILGLLAAARNGLSEDEILDVLSGDPEVLEDFRRRSPLSPRVHRLPVVAWARLHLDLAPFLAERAADGTTLFTFYHRQLREVAEADFLHGGARHADLAHHFAAQEPATREGDHTVHNLRMLAELPHQQRRAGMWADLERTLLERWQFLEAKAESGQIFDLARDFIEAIRALPVARPLRRHIQLVEEALRRDIVFLARHPTALFQALWNSCWWHDDASAAPHYVCAVGSPPWNLPGPKLSEQLLTWRQQKESQTPGFFWLRSLRPPANSLGTAQRAVILSHGGSINAVLITPDGRTVVSCGDDQNLIIWDVDGREPRIVALSGDVLGQHNLALSPDGALGAVVVSHPGYQGQRSIRVFDLLTGMERLRLPGSETDDCVAFMPDGRRVVNCSRSGEVGVTDAFTGERLQALFEVGENVRGIVAVDSQTIAIAREHAAPALWDLPTGTSRMTLGTDPAFRIAASGDGSTVVTWNVMAPVRLWDVRSGTERPSLPKHDFCEIAVSAEGRWIVIGSFETPEDLDARKSKMLRAPQRIISNLEPTTAVWDASIGARVRTLYGHTGRVTCLAVTPDGGTAVTGSLDASVRVWDLHASSAQLWLTDLRGGTVLLGFHPTKGSLFTDDGLEARCWDARLGLCREIAGSLGTAIHALRNSSARSGPWQMRMLEQDVARRPVFHPRLDRDLQEDYERKGGHLLEAEISGAGGTPVAWYPARFTEKAIHPDGCTWAGVESSGAHLHLFTLEGGESREPGRDAASQAIELAVRFYVGMFTGDEPLVRGLFHWPTIHSALRGRGRIPWDVSEATIREFFMAQLRKNFDSVEPPIAQALARGRVAGAVVSTDSAGLTVLSVRQDRFTITDFEGTWLIVSTGD